MGYRKAWEFPALLGQSRRVERLFTPADMEAEAYDLLEKQDDQDFSFVDAISFGPDSKMTDTRPVSVENLRRLFGEEIF